MKKIIAIILLFTLVISGLQSQALISTNDLVEQKNETIQCTFTKPLIKQSTTDYIEMSLNQEHNYIMKPGKAMLPRITKTIELPFGITDINIQFHANEIITEKINKEIKPAQKPQSFCQTDIKTSFSLAI